MASHAFAKSGKFIPASGRENLMKLALGDIALRGEARDVYPSRVAKLIPTSKTKPTMRPSDQKGSLVEGKSKGTAHPQRPELYNAAKRSQAEKISNNLVIKGIKPQEVAANMRASMDRFARLSKVT